MEEDRGKEKKPLAALTSCHSPCARTMSIRIPGSHSRRPTTPSSQSAASGTSLLPYRRSTEAESSEDDDSEASDTENLFDQPTEAGLPPATQKTLFLDIQDRGGLDTFSLKKLCDDKPDTYGTPASVFRRKVQNQVQRWKTHHRPEYDNLRLNRQQQHREPPPDRSPPSRQQPLPPGSPNLVPRRPRQLRFSPPIINSNRANMANPNPNPIPFLQALLARPDLEPIDVDLQRPENHGPLMVVPFTDRIIDEVLYDGFDIFLKMPRDMRWMFGDQTNFIAWYGGANQVVFKIPNVSFGWLNDPAVEDNGRRLAGLTDPRVNQALTVARNTIQQNAADRVFQHYLLQFPDGVTFDNDVFSPGTTNGKINSTVVPLYSQFEVPNSATDTTPAVQIQTSSVNIVWQIAISEGEPRYAGAARVQGQSDHQQQMNQLLAAIQRNSMN